MCSVRSLAQASRRTRQDQTTLVRACGSTSPADGDSRGEGQDVRVCEREARERIIIM